MVSVVIPTYNRADVISRSVKSILNQSYQDFEILVVDDGSTDNTFQVVKSFEDSRLRYLKNNKRMGANAARNTGIQNAKGEFIAFQDSDDIWRSDKLKKQMDLFREMKSMDIIYSRYLRHGADGKNIPVPPEVYTKDMLQEGIATVLAKSNVIGTPTMIAKKKCFQEGGMFDPKLQRFQDWEMNIRLVQDYTYGFMDEVLVDAYVSEDSITNTAGSGMGSIALIVKKHRGFFEAHGTLQTQLAGLVNLAVEEERLEELGECLGRELFFRAIYANVGMNVAGKTKVQKNYAFLKEWIARDNGGRHINSFFAGFPEQSVVLYGLGDIGKLFLNALTDGNRKKIRYIIDRNAPSPTGNKVLAMEMLGEGDFEGIECVIITAVAYEAEIREKLEGVTSSQIVSVYDTIADRSFMEDVSVKEF